MAEISIIVPVYNVEKYVEKCLNSLIHQTFSDIEIICIDDASTDKSLELVTRLSNADARIQVIAHSINLGTLQARKNGVKRATGKYLMFVDSDDWLELNACETLYNLMSHRQIDVIQFGSNVVPAMPLSNEMIRWVETFLSPYPEKLEKEEILRGCFVENKFDFNITDKIWRADLCKKAFDKIEDLKLIASEDRYAFFLLAYFAETYLGVPDVICYNYNLGIGITGGDKLDLNRFATRCSGVHAVDAVKCFLIKENALEAFQNEFDEFENKILWDCVDCWHNKLSVEDSAIGYNILLEYWGTWKIAAAIAKFYFEENETIQQKTNKSKALQFEQSVALYYRPTQSKEINDWIVSQVHKMQNYGQQIILFTDEDFIEDQMTVLLPSSSEANWDRYSLRAKVLYEELRHHNIMLVLYSSSFSHIAWLDKLLIESAHIPVIFFDITEYYQLSNKIDACEDMKNKIQKLEHDYVNLKKSKSYRLGELLLKIPRRIKQILISLFKIAIW